VSEIFITTPIIVRGIGYTLHSPCTEVRLEWIFHLTV
jgi:hypothetical protein